MKDRSYVPCRRVVIKIVSDVHETGEITTSTRRVKSGRNSLLQYYKQLFIYIEIIAICSVLEIVFIYDF